MDRETVSGQNYAGQATHASFGDLNGDGVLDVAATITLQGPPPQVAYISVCMGLGNGIFGPPAIYPAGQECCAVEMGDFDHDGHLDLAVTNEIDNTVSILFNRGDGTFGAPVNYAVGSQPRSLKVGDLNGDGRPDIAVLNCLSNDVSILINRGDGAFLPERRVFTGISGVTQRGNPNLTFPYPGPFLALGDFNRDGALDIAVPARDRVRLLMNDGAGNFALAPVTPFIIGADAYCIAVGDLNRDGKLDMAVAVTASGDHGVSILMGHGDGTFDPAVAYNADPLGPGYFVFNNHIDLGDLDGDGFPDMVVGSEISYARVVYFRNRGDGTFFPRQTVNADQCSWYVGLVDLSRRGKPDLAVLAPTLSRSALKVLLNDGAGTPLGYILSLIDATQQPDSQYGAATADLDGDGNLDLAVTVLGENGYQLKTCRGLGNGRFEPVGTLSLGPYQQSAGWGVALADVNGDHRPDVILGDTIVPGGGAFPGKIWVLANTGGFTFGTPVAYPLADATTTNIVAVDLNGDGRLDLAAWSMQVFPGNQVTPIDRRLQVLLNNGDGTFAPPVAYTIGQAPSLAYGSVAAADLDHDGRPDLIGTVGFAGLPGTVVILHNRGDGTFEPWASIPVASLPDQVIATDLSGDGFADLAIMHNHSWGSQQIPLPLDQPYITILYNDRTGHFPTRAEYIDPRFITWGQMTSADFDGDGRTDLAFPEYETRSVLVMLNHGDGTFDAPGAYGAAGTSGGHWPACPLPGDFDHSGRPGLAAVQTFDFVSYLPNLSCPRCYANCDASTTPPVLNINDFTCFLNRFAAADPAANCDASTTPPTLNVLDFICFLNRFAAGCP